MTIDDREWYRRKKRREAGLNPDGGYLKDPNVQHSGRPIRRRNVAAWIWGTLCVFTWIVYALEHQGFTSPDAVLNVLFRAASWMADSTATIYKAVFDLIQ